MISGVLLDLAGVIYEGEEALPGALNAVARLRDGGLPLCFLTNTTRTTKQVVKRKLLRLGLQVQDSEIFTPAQAARDWLNKNNRSPHLLVHPQFAQEFDSVSSGRQRAVVVGDAGDAFSYATLNRAFQELIEGAELLALAENRTFRDADGRLNLDAGPFVRALEFASRHNAIVVGKPSREFFASALAQMRCPPEKAVMVGDDAEVDVSGALRAGLANALLVRTGKYRPGDEQHFKPPATAVVDDIGAATEWIIAHH
jgi:HAD superfamily hydrolase (TIGR01458 family)